MADQRRYATLFAKGEDRRHRYRDAVAIVTEGIRRGQQSGAYRADLDPAVKAVEIIAFLHGMETSWLLDPSIPLIEVFRAYVSSPASQLALSPS